MKRHDQSRWVVGLLLLAWLLATAATVPVLNPAGEVSPGVTYTLINAQTVNATAVVTSGALDLLRGGYFGAWYKCTSVAGTPAILIEWLESPTLTDTDFVVAQIVEATLADELAHLKTISPPPMRYGQVRITGNGGNPADTLCTLKVYAQGW